MSKTIDELNAMIIKANFVDNRTQQVNDSPQPRVNDEMIISVQEHRRIHGLVSNFSIMRNFIKTKMFVKTVVS